MLLAALALALFQGQTPNVVTFDTGLVEAIPVDLWPYLHRGMKRIEVPSVPRWAVALNYDTTLSGQAAVDLTNEDDEPIWFEGSLTMRYDRWHDGDAWWCWHPRNAGSDFVVTASNPIPPGETRTVHLYWSTTIYGNQEDASVVDRWKDKYDWGLFDCYYPVIRSVRGVSVNPDNPSEAHALGAWASVGGTYDTDGDGLHEFPPRGRVRITARYQ